MVMSAASHQREDRTRPDEPRARAMSAVIWHELECGSYAVDMPLWRELAAPAGTGADAQPVLDVGAGIGRVALDLAARGHRVTALDLDADLLAALRERAGRRPIAQIPVETVCADARTFELVRRDFAVCLVPMQTIQLLKGKGGRMQLLLRARAHLRPGGLLACAIVTQIECFDCSAGDPAPSPEVAHVNGLRYVSRATRVQLDGASVRIERERSIEREPGIPAGEQPDRRNAAEGAALALPEHDVVELDRLTAAQLVREGGQAGLSPAGIRSIPATREHVGSEVVLLRA